MAVVLFIIVLVALILVHELGHFIVAKLSGMRVDEFGIGYPPRAWAFKRGETEYSLNWLPFGGFVRIYGEDETEGMKTDSARAFSARPRILQALTLVAGIVMNLVLAYVLVVIILLMGTPRALAPEEVALARNPQLAIASILPGTPAALAGLKEGDLIEKVTVPGTEFTGSDPAAFTAYIGDDITLAPLSFSVNRNGKHLVVPVIPRTGIIPAEPARLAIGVGVATVGVIPMPLVQAPIEGAKLTGELVKQTAVGLTHFFAGIFTLSADLSQVSGPIAIAGAVGNASSQGLASLLSITALISINLALINILPLPALDGGRLLFVLIEAIIRRPIKPSVARAMNTGGFIFLVLLMVVITGHDVLKLFG